MYCSNVIRTVKSERMMSTGQGMSCTGKERNVRHLVGQPERGCLEFVGGDGEILLRRTLYSGSQYFCTIEAGETYGLLLRKIYCIELNKYKDI